MRKNILIAFLLVATFFKLQAQDPAYPTAPAAPLNIVQAEYFVDTDPGFGNGTPIGISLGVDIANIPVAVNTGSLIAGVHRLYIRTLNAEGEWSVTSVRSFVVDFDPAYPAAPATLLNIVQAEYFVDTDPGFGNGTAITITPGVDVINIPEAVNTGTLVAGVHRVYIRTLNAEGEWAVTSVRSFVVDFDPAYLTVPATPLNVVQAEYFVDTDPGFGNGTAITVTPGIDINNISADINTASLVQGVHRLYIRTLNLEGEWAVTSVRSFVVNEDPFYPIAPAAPGNIIRAEYFFDTDPGFGNGTAITITPAVNIIDLTFPANTSSLTGGTHRLYIRSLDDWSITSIREFEVVAPPAKVVLSGALTGDHQTLKAAFDAINAGGGSGNVTATIIDNTTEPLQASLNQTNYTVLVVPQGNRIVEGNIANALVLLNEADNVTIDGLSQTGTNTLTIRNTNTGDQSNAIRIFGAAVNNTVKRCIVEASCTGNVVTTGALLVIVNNETSSNNIIDSNYIRPATVAGVVSGINVARQFAGSLGSISNTKISNNRVENVFANSFATNQGILIFNGVNNSIIRGNSVYNTVPFNNITSDASYFGIRVSSTTGSGNTIDSNYVGGSLPGATGGNLVITSPANSMGFFGITLNDAAVNPSSVTRNIIRNLDLDIANPGTTAKNPLQGINVTAANLQAFNNNVIGSEANSSILLHMKPGSTGAIGSFGYLIQTGCATPVANNFIGGLAVTNTPLSGSTVTPFFNIFDVRGNSSTLNFKNNTVGSATAGNITFNSTTAGTLSVPGIFVSTNALSPVFNIDSNTVRNITATGGASLLAIRNFLGNASTTSTNITFNGNTVSDLSVSGNTGNVRGIQHDVNAVVTNISQIINIDGNQISNFAVPSGTGISIQGIRIQNQATTVNRLRGRVTNNNITGLVNTSTGNVISRAIAVSNDIVTTDSLVIAGNNISNIVTNATVLSAVSVGEGNGIFYETLNSGVNGVVVTRDNIISNINAQSTSNVGVKVFGISLFGNNTITERNRVFGLSNAATSPSAKITGLYLRSRNDDANVAMIRNNMIATNTPTASKVSGLDMGDGAVNSTVYHNSVLTEGNATANSYAFFKSATAIADVKNNVFYNASAGSGTPYAVGLETNVNGYTGNNNYFVSPAGVSLGEIGGSAQTIATWRTATAQDVNTEEGISGTNTNAADLFMNKGVAQLFINTANTTEPIKLSDKGMSLPAVLFDFLGNSRSATTPDIGAHEFVFSGTLPLNLIFFTGSKQNNDALLQWKTANETGVSKFEVQRSNDGQTFATIGTVAAGGSLYSLTDANTFSSRTVAFYRLKSIDVDARFTWSNIIKLSKQASAAVTVYPNPVSDVLTISGLKQNGTVLLYSSEGKLLQQQTVTAQTITMDMSKYAKGIYLLQYKTGDEVVNQKIIKQ
jgi:hypothetical protein